MGILTKLTGSSNGTQSYSFATSKEERDNFCATIINSSSPHLGFYLLLIISSFIVTLGLIKSNLILLIGGMMIAPLLSPILAISLGITILNWRVFIRSVLVFLISALTSLIIAILIGLISPVDLESLEIIALMRSFDYYTLLIPIAAGAGASFTWAKKELNGSLPGVLITVTLLPPLTAMGLALADNNNILLRESWYIYFLNVAGIIIGSLIVFLLMGFYKSAKKLISQVEQEETK